MSIEPAYDGELGSPTQRGWGWDENQSLGAWIRNFTVHKFRNVIYCPPLVYNCCHNYHFDWAKFMDRVAIYLLSLHCHWALWSHSINSPPLPCVVRSQHEEVVEDKTPSLSTLSRELRPTTSPWADYFVPNAFRLIAKGRAFLFYCHQTKFILFEWFHRYFFF